MFSFKILKILKLCFCLLIESERCLMAFVRMMFRTDLSQADSTNTKTVDHSFMKQVCCDDINVTCPAHPFHAIQDDSDVPFTNIVTLNSYRRA